MTWSLPLIASCLLGLPFFNLFIFLTKVWGICCASTHTHTNKTEQNQTHMTVLNRVVNGISSTLGNDISLTHSHSVRRHHHPRSTKNKNERKKKEGEPC